MVQRFHIVIDARVRQASTGRYIDRLVTHLQALDHDNRYTVLVAPDDPWKPTGLNFTTVPCRYKQFSINPVEQIGFTLQLYRLKPDLVHFSMTQQPVLYFGNIVTTTHDLTMFKFVRRGHTPLPLYWAKMGLYRFLVHWSHRKSKKIIVPTQHVAEDIAKFQPTVQGKTVVTYESSESPLKVASQKPTLIGANDQFLLYVGTAFPHKNLFALAQAFDILARKYTKLKLVLIGKKEVNYSVLAKRISKLPSHGRIIMTGFVPDEQLKWAFEHCRAYVFPSLSEGFGLPGLEAIAHGAPVLASNATCLPEVYGTGARYFDPHSPEDMAAQIAEVLDDESLRKSLIKNGREQLDKYSWETMAQETLAVYNELLHTNTAAEAEKIA